MKAFAGNKNVAFGDVNLSENPIRRNYQPGAGGWPTIRLFDGSAAATTDLLEGKAYEKKTEMSMCDELGPDHPYLHDWVAEYANPCSVVDGSGCDERQLQYWKKQKESNDEKLWKQQLERLEKLEAGDMKPELLQWIQQRKKILQALMMLPPQQADEHAEL